MLQAQNSLLLWKRGIKRGATNLFREKGWATALGALCGVFLLLQLLALILLGIEGTQDLLKDRSDIRLELMEEATHQQSQEFFSTIGQLPYVEEAVFITRQQAYAQTRERDPELIAFIEEFSLKNPFSDTIGVTLVSLDNYVDLKGFIESERWQGIIDPAFLTEVTDQEKNIKELLGVTHAFQSLTMFIVFLTITAILFITMELVRRRALLRSDEVLVERLVGASPTSILIPFVVEAMILLIISILVSTLLLLLVTVLLPLIIPSLDYGGTLGSLRREVEPLLSIRLPVYIIIELIAAPIIAITGAWLGIRPQIRSPRIALAH